MNQVNQNFDTNSKNDDSWNEYLAGLIDGDGCLLISKAGYGSLEITMDLHDKDALDKLSQKVGGSVKRRSDSKAFRYRLHRTALLKDLIHRINGKIRTTKRIPQLKRLCELYNIPFIEPLPLTLKNGWFAGFFDADGTIGFSMKNNWPQLIVSVAQKYESDLLPFKSVFGGVVRLDIGSSTYKWDIYSQEAVLEFQKYLTVYPLYSHKKSVFLY